MGAGLIATATAFGGDPVAERAGGNVAINASAGIETDFTGHNSPTLVRNPRDAEELAVANRIDTPRYSCALHVSSDGGASWSQTPLPVPEGEEPRCYAPDVAYGADGTLYLAFVTLEGRGNVPNAVWISRSIDGGRTLSPPERVLGELAFQVRLEADPEVAERLYLTWLQASDVGLYQFTEPGNPIMFRSSEDGGESWDAPARVSAPEHERAVAATLAVGEEGLFALYLDLGDDRLDYHGGHEGEGGGPYPGRWRLVLSRSTDGGRSWEERTVDEQIVPTERFIVFTPPFPSLAVDRSRGRLYASFHDGRAGDADVWLWASGDGGATFREPIRVNDNQRGDGTTQRLPELAVAPNGRLDVTYYDRRHDPDDIMSEVSLQASHDAGATFAPPVNLADRPFNSRVGFGLERDLPDLGSRIGADATDAASLAAWTDTRAGTTATLKQDLALGAVAHAQPRDLSDPARYALLAGGGLFALAGAGLLVLYWRRTVP